MSRRAEHWVRKRGETSDCERSLRGAAGGGCLSERADLRLASLQVCDVVTVPTNCLVQPSPTQHEHETELPLPLGAAEPVLPPPEEPVLLLLLVASSGIMSPLQLTRA
jgi:hypothetical protein